MIMWDLLRAHTGHDIVISKVMDQVGRGFPDSSRDVHQHVQPYHQYRKQLSIVDGVLCYKTRVVIPTTLRQEVLQTLHSAHQGTTGMINRAEQAVFWPGMHTDIQQKRSSCRACMANAPSQPAGPPVKPPSPEYPFQLMVGDYFSKAGRNYLVIAARNFSLVYTRLERENLMPRRLSQSFASTLLCLVFPKNLHQMTARSSRQTSLRSSLKLGVFIIGRAVHMLSLL